MLEINKQNIDEIVRLEKYDLEVSAKWILNARSDNARIRVPETHEERLQYINDWLSVCPKGTNAKIQEYKNYITYTRTFRPFRRIRGIQENVWL